MEVFSEEKVLVLSVLKDSKSPRDILEIAEKTYLTKGILLRALGSMVSFGLVDLTKEKPGKFFITEEGKYVGEEFCLPQISKDEAGRRLASVLPDSEFYFDDGDANVSIEYRAWTLKEFCQCIKIVSPECFADALEDFADWFRNKLKDDLLANKIAEIIDSCDKEEELRDKIYKTCRVRYARLVLAAEGN